MKHSDTVSEQFARMAVVEKESTKCYRAREDSGSLIAVAAPPPSVARRVHYVPHQKLTVNPSTLRLRKLSKREQEVLHWLAHGKSGGEIGMILSISLPTVRVHIRNIISKLNASNIPHAIARAFKLGIL